jgi:hypothetical protein
VIPSLEALGTCGFGDHALDATRSAPCKSSSISDAVDVVRRDLGGTDELDQDAPVGGRTVVWIAALAACLTKELGDSYGLVTGLLEPVLVSTPLRAPTSEILVEQQEAPSVQEWRQPSERTKRRSVEIRVEMGEGDATDLLGKGRRERVLEKALDDTHTSNGGRRAGKRTDVEILVRLRKSQERVASEDLLLPGSEDLSSMEVIDRSFQGSRRTPSEHAELNDVAGNAVRESHCDFDDHVTGDRCNPASQFTPLPGS